jgi:phytoene dehydrogenase-like protein
VPRAADVAIVGAGHNGLVADTLLARAGLQVTVLEAAPRVGGACRTERPFPRAPDLRQSTGAYLLGPMPPELLDRLELDLPLVRRDPHYFLPTRGDRRLLLGADRGEAARSFASLFSERDRRANRALQTELAALRDDVWPALLQDPLPLEEAASRFVRPALRRAFLDLCRGSVVSYLERFGFESELLVAMYVVTDGLTGLSGGPDTPGSGYNFLLHNLCRLPGSDGTWMLVEGGMGTVTTRLAELATGAGATIVTGARVAGLDVGRSAATGVVLADGRAVAAPAVLGTCDPFRLAAIAGSHAPAELCERLNRVRRPGTTLKVNLLPEGGPSPFGSTMHLLPEDQPLHALRRIWQQVEQGRLPEQPPVEWYVDPGLTDGHGHHSSALFVQSVPAAPAGAPWEALLPPYVEHLLAICDRFAPGTSALVDDVFALPPPGIEAHFGITGGHILHVDNAFSFTDRIPYATGLPGLYAGGAGCHPGGSVTGAPGHNAARRILDDLGVAP